MFRGCRDDGNRLEKVRPDLQPPQAHASEPEVIAQFRLTSEPLCWVVWSMFPHTSSRS
jgi:hypothetical protein